ncbi:ABC transporter transmembrane domain-containing protein [Prochlorococcus marinus]|uniref:Peptidase C39 n=1 Tax=Prochlorococcus marinus XMU1408 TaxID=2213228 RepID=A0A318QWU9_PROMR|nr:ABC transporter transmembrane domain-containing protein [Prochlorococcus marinus]MBW3042873.1 peptidase C39 [Prochlorococcus marinus str. XMU1408]PYE00699.1 peptidase C39 [Prochlorococcus marinus XMU1408]
MNINFREIEAFKNIDAANIEKLKADAQLIKFSLGQPLCKKEIIPNKVFIILQGQARFLHDNGMSSETIVKLKPITFVGLSSILRAHGCEEIMAVNELIAIGLSDTIILDLYENDLNFRDWCQSKIQFPEIYSIANHLNENLPKKIFNLKELINILIKNIRLKSIVDEEILEPKEDYVSIAGSDNIDGYRLYDLINVRKKISIRGKLDGRVFEIPKEIYEKISQLSSSIDSNNDTLNNGDFSVSDSEYTNPDIYETVEDMGQYKNNKNFKIIRAKGELRETIACLQMLASELNLPYRVDAIDKILRDNLTSGKKPTIQLLGSITSMMGLRSFATKLPAKFANRLPSPSLIVWKEAFAVVKESRSDFLEIISPSEGSIKIQPEHFNESFPEGFIELLSVEKHEQTPEVKFGIQWLLPSINKYKGVLSQVLLASFVVQLFGLANPLMIQIIIDKVINQRSMDTLQILGLALVVITILGGIIGSLRTFLFTETTNRIDTRLGAEVIDHLLRLPLNYFDRRPVGELGSRVAELEKIRNFLTGQALTTILDAAFSLIYIIVMLFYSWLLTLLALGVVPIQILITLVGTPLIRRQIREIAQENAKTQSHLVEILTGIQTVKAQNVERVSRWKWQELYNTYIAKSFQKTITGTALGETSQVLQQISQLVVLWAGASLVLKGELTLGQLIAFRIISSYVTQPLLRLSTIWQNIQELRVSFERLGDIIDTPEETSDKDKEKIPLPSITGNVEFKNIFFTFNDDKDVILKNINLKIKSGQFVGVVGQSGSGKSTLMKLLPRLYKPQGGKVLIDNYDVNKVELYSLRRQIGIVPQEPLLFAGSINSNIALTDPEAPSEEIVKAARIANAHDFIMDLNDGYSTNIGERGSGLSGGQKQRIAIARTLLSNPKLLIMDEATSALDYETERKVCEGLRSSSKGRTVFFITHRLSTVKNSDLILMLHEGTIVETGTHEELMNLKGRYFALYCQQESN